MDIVETNSLTKKFGPLIAVDGVSLSIREGEIFGLLGPNGAGKTTLISMLATMKKPTSGSARVNGFDVVKEAGEARRSLGIVFQDPSLDEELTAYENLELHGAMYGMEREEREERISEVMETVGLTDRLHHVVKTFSGGMRRRLEIARGLLHCPRILFLDEPTIGLDPQTRNHVWEYIKKLKKEHSITIILTTHYMDEADSLCDRVAIIDYGRIIALGTPEALRDSLGGDIVIIRTPQPERMAEAVRNIAKEIRIDGNVISISVERAEKKIVQITDMARKRGIMVESIGMHRPTLDDVFLHYTGRTIREESAGGKEAMRMRRMAWRRRER